MADVVRRFGHPYQPLFWFDEHGRALGLVVDPDGRVLAWENNEAGDPEIAADPACQHLPAEVEQAAWDWWRAQVGG